WLHEARLLPGCAFMHKRGRPEQLPKWRESGVAGKGVREIISSHYSWYKARCLRYINEVLVPEIAQRTWDFSGHVSLPDLSSSVHIGRLRYIQSIYEEPECRNPDRLEHHLLSPPLRWLSSLQAKTQRS